MMLTSARASAARIILPPSLRPSGRRGSPDLFRAWRALAAVILAVVLAAAGQAWGELPPERKCQICHGRPDFKVLRPDGRVERLYVDPDVIASSAHAGRECEDCHADITEIPHAPGAERVICTRCHFAGNPSGAPQTDMYKDYSESVHGVEAREGNPRAPVCQDCHGSHGVRAPADTASTVYKTRVPELCGSCHLESYADYRTSVHGVALIDEGHLDAPACTDCHGEHRILRHTLPGSSVYPTNVGRTCAVCHAAEAIMSKYGIETAQVETYEESYHGIAGKFGERTVANCASCHGVHDIRPKEDPRSLVNIANIPRTCGKCHPGANANFARGKIHVEPKSKESGAIYYVSNAFKWLTITVILSLVVHIILDFNRKRRSRKRSH